MQQQDSSGVWPSAIGLLVLSCCSREFQPLVLQLCPPPLPDMYMCVHAAAAATAVLLYLQEVC